MQSFTALLDISNMDFNFLLAQAASFKEGLGKMKGLIILLSVLGALVMVISAGFSWRSEDPVGAKSKLIAAFLIASAGIIADQLVEFFYGGDATIEASFDW